MDHPHQSGGGHVFRSSVSSGDRLSEEVQSPTAARFQHQADTGSRQWMLYLYQQPFHIVTTLVCPDRRSRPNLTRTDSDRFAQSWLI